MPPSHPSIAFNNESEPSILDEEMDYSHVGDPPTTNLSMITELSEPSPEAHFPHSLPRSPLSQTWPAQQSAPIPEESDVEELTAEQNEPTPKAYLSHSLPRPPLSQTRPTQPSAPIPEESDLDELTAVQDSAAGAKISGVQPLGFVVTGSIPSDIIGSKSQPADSIRSHKSMSHLADRKSGPLYQTGQATATRIGPKKVVIPHGYSSPAEPEDSEQGDDSQSHPDDEEPTAVAPELNQSPATEKFNTISTHIFTAPYLSSPVVISHVAQESEARSPTSQIDFQTKTSLPSGNNSDLPPEPLDAPGFTDKPIHPDLPRSEHAAIESREVKMNVSPGAAAHELKEPPVTTLDQSKDFISTCVASNPSVYLQPQRSKIKADTPAPETISSAAYSGRDEIGERFTAVPTRGPPSEDFDSDGVGDPATAPEGTHLGKLDSQRRPVIFALFSSNFLNVSPKAIPQNRLQMAEHEDWSEGNSSEAKTSEPRPACSSIGHFAAELSLPLEPTDDNGPVQRHDATTVSYAGPEETPTSGLEPSTSRSIGRDDIAEPENRTSISLHPNPLTEIVAPIAEASDDAPFQGSTTPDLTGRNKVPLEGLMSPTADASSALLESKPATDESESDVANDEEAPKVDPTDLVEPLVARQLDLTSKKQDPVFDKPYVANAELDPVFDESYVSNSEEEPEFLPDHAVQQPVVEDRDSNSDAIFDSAGHAQDTEADTQYYPEPATATITDANSAEPEGTVEAEPLPRDTGVVHNLRPISPEAEGSSNGEQSDSLLTKTAAGPSHEHTGLAKAVTAFQVADGAEPVLARSAPFSNKGKVDIPTAAHSDSTETGASSIPSNFSPERQASDNGSVNNVQDAACAADAGPETTLISEYLVNPTPHTHASESSSSEDDLDVSHTLDASLIHPSNATELPMSASNAHLFDLQPSRAV
ncbi:hypothetical protein PCANC_13842 [Puccinia coronata f. sp. avenae]|uniref:Uncharacterized protein n=1 Tax=Puccinia coronata f. sp. avenae TaxID=200324 RepID=A0A2N5UD82_9BASI|nr:hypothetical protein PCANC_13842 [Puccinia coronata f. sp. avenae]